MRLFPRSRGSRVGDANPAKTLWLVKDDPKGQWFCKCPQGIVDAPYHDANTTPYGGTGWLFTCVKCQVAFMFARAVHIKPTLEELAIQRTPRTIKVMDIDCVMKEETLLAGPQDWLDRVLPVQAELELGQRYVFFDGKVLPAVQGPVKFRGLFREHDLPNLPHLTRGGEDKILGNDEYWYPEE